jgi:uncharacterized membrane protein
MRDDSDEVIESVGQDPERLATLSDGLFAIAMTLAALDVHIVARKSLLDMIAASGVGLAAFAVSFAITSIFWMTLRELFAQLRRTDNVLTLLILAMLACIALVPATVRPMVESEGRHGSFQGYAASVLLCGLLNTAAWAWAVFRPGLMREPLSGDQRFQRVFAVALVPLFFAPLLLLPPWLYWPVFLLLVLLTAWVRRAFDPRVRRGADRDPGPGTPAP